MDRTPALPGARANPAGQPGQGMGNVPFAPGIMSGNLGGGQPPLAREMSGGMTINIGGGQPPAEQPPGQVPQPGGPAQAGPPPMMGQPEMAQLFVEFLNAYMTSLLADVKKPIVGGIY